MPFVGEMKIINGYVCKYNALGQWLTIQTGENPYLVGKEEPEPIPYQTPPIGPVTPDAPPEQEYAVGALQVIGTKLYRYKDMGDGTFDWGLSKVFSTYEEAIAEKKRRESGIMPSPPVVTPPVITPPTTPPTEPTTPTGFEQYVMDIKAPVNPELPTFIVNRLKSVVARGGWELVSIQKSVDGYHLNLNKIGSVSVAAIAGIIVSILILFGIVSWTITRVSDNRTETAVAKSKQEYAQIVTDYSIATGEDLTDVINDINAAFPEEPPVEPSGIMAGLGGLFENLPLLIGGIMVITLVQTLKK